MGWLLGVRGIGAMGWGVQDLRKVFHACRRIF